MGCKGPRLIRVTNGLVIEEEKVHAMDLLHMAFCVACGPLGVNLIIPFSEQMRLLGYPVAHSPRILSCKISLVRWQGRSDNKVRVGKRETNK